MKVVATPAMAAICESKKISKTSDAIRGIDIEASKEYKEELFR